MVTNPLIYFSAVALAAFLTGLSKGGLLDIGEQVKLLWLAPLVPLGVRVGKRLAQCVRRDIFENIILVLLGISGVLLLAR